MINLILKASKVNTVVNQKIALEMSKILVDELSGWATMFNISA